MSSLDEAVRRRDRLPDRLALPHHHFHNRHGPAAAKGSGAHDLAIPPAATRRRGYIKLKIELPARDMK